MGSNEYSTTAVTAGIAPIPKKGIIKPSRAILGIAWITFAMDNTILLAFDI